MPATLVVSRHDRVIKPAYAEAASRPHGWSLAIIEDAGHVAFIDQPDATVHAVLAAIRVE